MKEEILMRLGMADLLNHYNVKQPPRNNANISCPFPGEKDKHPSFTVDVEKNLWHDKRSAAGGDIFSFIARMEGLDEKSDFSDIMKIAADMAGVDMIEPEVIQVDSAKEELPIVKLFKEKKGLDLSSLGGEIRVANIGSLTAVIIDTKTPAGKVVGEQRHYGDRKSLKKESKNGLFMTTIDKSEPLYIVEGVTDYLTMKQCGYKNTIGVCSATTKYKDFLQPVIEKMDAEVRICYDFDREKRTFTGFKAAMKIKTKHAARVMLFGSLYGDINDAFMKSGKAGIERIFGDKDFIHTAQEIMNPDESFSPASVARGILKKHSLAKFDKAYWRYANGIWGQISDDEVKSFVVNEFERTYAMSHDRKQVSEVEYYISIFCSTQSGKLKEALLSRGLAPENKDYIFLKDGKYNVFTGELMEYRPEDCVVSTLGFSSSEIGGRCYKWDKLMDDIHGDYEDAKERIAFIEQWLGYCLYSSAKFEKMLWMVGGGGNGKGTTLSVFSGLLGEGNTRNIQISMLDKDQFARATMFGVYANIVADAERASNISSAVLKNLVGGDKISARHLYRDTFEFVPFAKQIFGTNELPSHVRAEAWLQRRMMMIEFPKSFKANPNSDLKEELVAEYGAIALKAIRGLKKLLEDGKFIEPKSVTDYTDKFIETQDVTLDYFKNEMPSSLKPSVTHHAGITIKMLYEDFKNYCLDCGTSPRFIKTSKQFLMEFAKHAAPYKITMDRGGVYIPDTFWKNEDFASRKAGWEFDSGD